MRRARTSDSIADCPWPPAFFRSWTNGDPDAAWMHVAGDLNLATAPHLVRTLHEPRFQARLVVLDLRDLVAVDSFGVRAIVNATKRARRLGHRLVLLRGPPHVDRVFRLTASSEAVEIGDIDPIEPPVRALLQLADGDLGS